MTIIATAILGVIFINFMGTAMSKSVRSVEMVQGEASAEAVLERIIADYVLKMNQNNATALGLIKTDIDNKNVYGDNVSAAYIIFDSSGNEVRRYGRIEQNAESNCRGRGQRPDNPLDPQPQRQLSSSSF